MELLREERGNDNLTVYGNEYLEESTSIARDLWNHVAPKNLGSLCIGDSVNLSFVPNETFVFTGYLEPLLDPLALSNVPNPIENINNVHRICDDTGWVGTKLAMLAQRAQEDWFGLLVTEMVRIAKPGKLIAIEEVSKPACVNGAPGPNGHLGGVDKNWWPRAIETYRWDVEVEEIAILNILDDSGESGRYNVLLRKKDVITCNCQ
jgi:hypothetical protein